MAHGVGQELVPDGLWKIVEPLIPPRRERPQGGGTRYVDDRAVVTGIVHVLTTGCAWRHLPAEFGVSNAAAHRRFVAWTAAGRGHGAARQPRWRTSATTSRQWRAHRPFQPAPAARC
ncbi:MAG TPA: transposase [Geodermatophilus sp.]|nr:transposase [Geodermatophilus sp.]